MTNRIYALVGPHGAGKSTMAFLLKEMGIHYIPVYTTHIFPMGDPGRIKIWSFIAA